jgi:arsenate reductase (glutaredoxin)
MTTTIYHNPRCSKSRATLEILKDKNIPYETVEYLNTPPTPQQLSDILEQLGQQPQDIIRFGESIAHQLKISAQDQRTHQEWLELMVQNPILIERPIVVANNKAALGRPPESVLKIL